MRREIISLKGGGNPGPPTSAPLRGEGSFNITNCLHFPSSGNLHSTLHCIALHSPSDRKVYLNMVKKGINIFSKKWFLQGGTIKFFDALTRANFAPPPYINALVRPWSTVFHITVN